MKKKAVNKSADCEFDYWIIFVYVFENNESQVALFKNGSSYVSFCTEDRIGGFDGIKKLVTKQLGIDESMSYRGRFVNGGKDLKFPFDKYTLVWTSVVRIQEKNMLKPKVEKYMQPEWFSKEDALEKLKGTKYEYAFKNEFTEDTFWEGLDE